MPPNAGLFSITRFLYGRQKIITNKNIFSKDDLHVLFISFFSKMYNKKKYLWRLASTHEHSRCYVYFSALPEESFVALGVLWKKYFGRLIPRDIFGLSHGKNFPSQQNSCIRKKLPTRSTLLHRFMNCATLRLRPSMPQYDRSFVSNLNMLLKINV